MLENDIVKYIKCPIFYNRNGYDTKNYPIFMMKDIEIHAIHCNIDNNSIKQFQTQWFNRCQRFLESKKEILIFVKISFSNNKFEYRLPYNYDITDLQKRIDNINMKIITFTQNDTINTDHKLTNNIENVIKTLNRKSKLFFDYT